MNNTLIFAKDIWKIYSPDHEAEVQAVRGVTFEIKEGAFILIIGPSGCGKSTLLYILSLLDQPTKGKIEWEGKNVNQLNDREITKIRLYKMGFVFQSFNLLPTLNVFNNIAILLKAAHISLQDQEKKIKSLLNEFGLEKRVYHSVTKLSGGEKQRVAIARALACDPKIIFADEPTGNLDSETGDKIFELFLRLNEKGKTIVMVTHNEEYAKRIKNVIQMKDGKFI